MDKKSRQRFGIEMLSRRDGILDAVKILKNNGCVAVLFDQNAGGAGCESLLFDRLCYTSELAGILTEKRARAAQFFRQAHRILALRGLRRNAGGLDH